MSAQEILAILPVLWVAGAAVVLLPLAAFHRSGRLALVVALVGFMGGLLSLPAAAGVAPVGVSPLLVVDRFALLFQALFLGAGAVVAVLARDYLERLAVTRSEELVVLLLLGVAGAMILAAARHFAAFFLGLEILTVALYGMVAYLKDGDAGLEAGIKYLVLAGASSGFLLFGLATLYLAWGTMSLPDLPAASLAAGWSPLVLAGMALFTVGLGFKLALVPFHFWTPDVYQGAPAPVTAFLATVSKGAVLAFLLRLAMGVPGFRESPLWSGLAALAVASMVVGNLLALLQDDLKRILAYSSIAHLGYLLVPVLAGGRDGAPATAFYLAAYFVTTLAAFGVVSALGNGEIGEGELARFRGLWSRRPFWALSLSGALFSLSGLPITAGFVGKFYLLAAGVGRGLWGLAFVLAGTSIVGLFYYLRVISALFASAEAEDGAPDIGQRWATSLALALLLVLVVGAGLWPGPLLELLRGGTGMAIMGGS
ncbi:MAG: NADH-quinone oxidoreductase subunit N [Gemmatimonadota bacterium]|jgi:NADH-quinone oxidoreductase subunit N